jgi:hypothetical protein
LRYRILFLAVASSFGIGCKDDSSIAASVVGRFVADSFYVRSTSTNIHGTDSSFVTCEFNYHFENLSGTIDVPTYVIGFDTVRPTQVVSYYEPLQPNVPLRMSRNFWYRRRLLSTDSVFCHYIVHGYFWSRISRDSTRYYGTISDEDSVMVVVQN